MIALHITASTLIARTTGRTVELERLELNYKVRALQTSGVDIEVARVFAFTGAARSAVIELAKRKRVLA